MELLITRVRINHAQPVIWKSLQTRLYVCLPCHILWGSSMIGPGPHQCLYASMRMTWSGYHAGYNEVSMWIWCAVRKDADQKKEIVYSINVFQFKYSLLSTRHQNINSRMISVNSPYRKSLDQKISFVVFCIVVISMNKTSVVKTSFYFYKIFVGHMSICRATDTPFLNF